MFSDSIDTTKIILLLLLPSVRIPVTSPLDRDTEVIFLVDASRGVAQDVFRRQKEFVKRVSAHFNISATGPYGSVASYDTFTYVVAGFSQPNFNKRVDDAAFIGMPRRMDKALQQAALQLSRSGRSGRKIVILLTAGKQTAVPGVKPLSEAVKPLQKLGAQTFVVAVGQNADRREVLPVVDSSGDVFLVPVADRLPSQSQPIAKHIHDKPGNRHVVV